MESCKSTTSQVSCLASGRWGQRVTGPLEQTLRPRAQESYCTDDDDGDEGNEYRVLNRRRACFVRLTDPSTVTAYVLLEKGSGRHAMGRGGLRSLRRHQRLMLLAVSLKMFLRLVPRSVTAAMITIAISATSRPYSTADAPRSLRAFAGSDDTEVVQSVNHGFSQGEDVASIHSGVERLKNASGRIARTSGERARTGP